jgi:hypothetical protein
MKAAAKAADSFWPEWIGEGAARAAPFAFAVGASVGAGAYKGDGDDLPGFKNWRVRDFA